MRGSFPGLDDAGARPGVLRCVPHGRDLPGRFALSDAPAVAVRPARSPLGDAVVQGLPGRRPGAGVLSRARVSRRGVTGPFFRLAPRVDPVSDGVPGVRSGRRTLQPGVGCRAADDRTGDLCPGLVHPAEPGLCRVRRAAGDALHADAVTCDRAHRAALRGRRLALPGRLAEVRRSAEPGAAGRGGRALRPGGDERVVLHGDEHGPDGPLCGLEAGAEGRGRPGRLGQGPRRLAAGLRRADGPLPGPAAPAPDPTDDRRLADVSELGGVQLLPCPIGELCHADAAPPPREAPASHPRGRGHPVADRDRDRVVPRRRDDGAAGLRGHQARRIPPARRSGGRRSRRWSSSRSGPRRGSGRSGSACPRRGSGGRSGCSG